jgi:cytochrome o ubiquinol oxidase subunit 2
MKRVGAFILVLCAATGAVIAVALFAHAHGANFDLLHPMGPIAFEERHVLLLALALSSIVVLPTFFVLFFFASHYREDGPHAHDKHTPDWDHDSTGAEVFWWLVPSVIIVVLSAVAWQSTHALDPFSPIASDVPPVHIEVVALDWKWLFIYPDEGIASVNQLVIPVDTPVSFSLTADAPMNSFWIPSLGGQIMVMPGMETQLNLLASSTGSFHGLSGNLSGSGFAGMNFTVDAVSEDEFHSWVALTASSSPLDEASYAALAAPSSYDVPHTYALTDPHLYTAIMMKYMMPGTMTMP